MNNNFDYYSHKFNKWEIFAYKKEQSYDSQSSSLFTKSIVKVKGQVNKRDIKMRTLYLSID